MQGDLSSSIHSSHGGRSTAREGKEPAQGHGHKGLGADGPPAPVDSNGPARKSHLPTFTQKPWRQDRKRLEAISWFVYLSPASS